MITVIAHTDGACSGNPGVGGYCGIITCNGREKIVRGHEVHATNNMMELKAIVEVVRCLTKPCSIEIHTDSKYIFDCTTHKKKDWFSNRPNSDLWFQLIEAGNKGGHKIRFVKVKGHSGDEYNERCDRIAKEECVIARHELYERMTSNA